MSHANTITSAFSHNSNLALEAARSIAIAEDQYWASETSVFVFDDDSRIAFSGSDFWEVVGRRREMLVELMDARERGVTNIWYGNIENAEPVAIEEAINDISKMDDFDIGNWGEWTECLLPNDECDHDGGCDSCPHKS